MVDKKITELTEDTTPVLTDIVPHVDLVAGETKKVTWTNISTLVFSAKTTDDLTEGSTNKYAVGTEISSIVEDTTPQLGGTLDTNSKSIQGNFEVLTGTTPTADWNTGNHKDITLSGNTTMTFTNPTLDAVMTLEITLGGTPYTLTLPTIDWLDTAPTLKDNARTLIALRWNGTAYTGDWK